MNSSLPAHSWPSASIYHPSINTSTAVLELLLRVSVAQAFGAYKGKQVLGVSDSLDYWYLTGLPKGTWRGFRREASTRRLRGSRLLRLDNSIRRTRSH